MQKLGDVLHGRDVETSQPPSLDIVCSHLSQASHSLQQIPRHLMFLQALPNNSVKNAAISHVIHSTRRIAYSRAIANLVAHIPSPSHRFIFPLYHPSSVDVVIFWEIPSQRRSGCFVAWELMLGAGHGALQGVIEEAEGSKAKRMMYAETQREKLGVLEAIRGSEWNVETKPLLVTVQAAFEIEHEFSKGCVNSLASGPPASPRMPLSSPCMLPAAFKIRNYSLTHPSRFVLRLAYDPSAHPTTT
jgi:hypothetical protein